MLRCCFAFSGKCKSIVKRVKGIFYTDKGWFIVNGADGIIHKSLSIPATSSRVEIIAMQNHLPDILSILNQCRIDDNEKEQFDE